MMRAITTCVLVGALVPWAPAARAEDVDPGMEAIAKELLRRTTSNAQRASLLHEAAADAKDNKKLRIYLNERALEYALRSVHVESSRRVAYYAISQLGNDAPERRDHWYAMRIEMYRRHYHSPLAPAEKRRAGHYFVNYLISYARRYEQERRWEVALPMYKEAAGLFEAMGLPGKNELAAMEAKAVRRAETYAKIKALEEQYKKNTRDPEVRKKLAMLWIIDMDYASRGAQYISSRENKAWHDCAHQTGHSLRELKVAEQALKVADWYYKEIAPLASPVTRGDMLRRARTYYQHTMALKDGLSRTKRKEIAETLAKVSAELQGGPRPEWVVIFRSEDSAVWNTNRSTGTLSYALPLGKIGGPVRYLRMTRMDTGQFVIIPMKAMWLDRTQSVTKTHGWQGQKHPVTGGGYRWGIYSRNLRSTSSRTVNITYSYQGWGFGYNRRARTKAAVRTWGGRALDKTTFKIDVTNGDLTPAEAKCLLE